MEREKVENFINQLYIGMARSAMGNKMPTVADYPDVAKRSGNLVVTLCREGTATVCEAAFMLKRSLQEHDLPNRWVDEFVYLYLEYLSAWYEEAE